MLEFSEFSTFQIHRLHRVEVRKWKSRNLAQHLDNLSQWNSLRGMPFRTGSRTMSQPARAFHSNKWIFLDKIVSINSKLNVFEATVTPIACFAARHRSIRQHDLHILEVEFRRLVRPVVGPPFGVCWSSPWHEILHEWNARVQLILEYRQHKSWGQTALCHHWKLAGYIANLPPNRWAK